MSINQSICDAIIERIFNYRFNSVVDYYIYYKKFGILGRGEFDKSF